MPRFCQRSRTQALPLRRLVVLGWMILMGLGGCNRPSQPSSPASVLGPEAGARVNRAAEGGLQVGYAGEPVPPGGRVFDAVVFVDGLGSAWSRRTAWVWVPSSWLDGASSDQRVYRVAVHTSGEGGVRALMMSAPASSRIESALAGWLRGSGDTSESYALSSSTAGSGNCRVENISPSHPDYYMFDCHRQAPGSGCWAMVCDPYPPPDWPPDEPPPVSPPLTLQNDPHNDSVRYVSISSRHLSK